MKCLKCGTTIPSELVFCESCQEEMDRHPVKPGTPILLPKRPERHMGKTSHKRVKKPEEVIANLRSLIFWLLLVIMALLTALGISIWMIFTI